MMYVMMCGRSIYGLSGGSPFYILIPRDRPKRPSICSISSAAFTPSLLTFRMSSRWRHTKSFSRRTPTLSRGIAILMGMSNSVIDDDRSCSMCNLISSYLSKLVSDVGVVNILGGRLKNGEGNHPLSQVKPISYHQKVRELIDSAKLILYFRLSNTCLTAFVAISGVTVI